jgi:hypothetical protein
MKDDEAADERPLALPAAAAAGELPSPEVRLTTRTMPSAMGSMWAAVTRLGRDDSGAEYDARLEEAEGWPSDAAADPR